MDKSKIGFITTLILRLFGASLEWMQKLTIAEWANLATIIAAIFTAGHTIDKWILIRKNKHKNKKP